MSHAPKKISAIPIHLAVNAFTSEALLDDTLKKLGHVVKLIGQGSDEVEVWKAFVRLSDRMITEARQYRRDLEAIERYANKG